MYLSDLEALDVLHKLLTRYVPDSFDRRNVLEKLATAGQKLFAPQSSSCPNCKRELVCLRCASVDIQHEVDVTVRINGVEIYG